MLYRHAAAERGGQIDTAIRMMNIYTRGTENNKKLMKLSRGEL
jgi:hypothetical protein